jgi:hypothetical protein
MATLPSGEVSVWLYNTLADCVGANKGDIVYTVDTDAFQYWNGTVWKPLGGGGGAVSPVTLTAHTPTEVPLTVEAAASQTADLFDVTNSAGIVMFSVQKNGTLKGAVGGDLNLISDANYNVVLTPGGAGAVIVPKQASFTSTVGHNGNFDYGISPLGVNAGAGPPSYGGGSGPMIFLANDVADPTTNPTGGGILFVSAGALKYRGSAGTVTVIAPA